jgi:hypothetical protein
MTFVQVAPNIWVKEATVGWVVYVGDTAHYFPQDQYAQAMAAYDQAKQEGKWASRPQPAHMGT